MSHRSVLLYYLLRTDRAASVDGPVEHLSERFDTDTITIKLDHAILLNLDDADVIAYDPEEE